MLGDSRTILAHVVGDGPSPACHARLERAIEGHRQRTNARRANRVRGSKTEMLNRMLICSATDGAATCSAVAPTRASQPRAAVAIVSSCAATVPAII